MSSEKYYCRKHNQNCLITANFMSKMNSTFKLFKCHDHFQKRNGPKNLFQNIFRSHKIQLIHASIAPIIPTLHSRSFKGCLKRQHIHCSQKSLDLCITRYLTFLSNKFVELKRQELFVMGQFSSHSTDGPQGLFWHNQSVEVKQAPTQPRQHVQPLT